MKPFISFAERAALRTIENTGLRTLGKTVMKIAGRCIPGLNIALNIYDLYQIGKAIYDFCESRNWFGFKAIRSGKQCAGLSGKEASGPGGVEFRPALSIPAFNEMAFVENSIHFISMDSQNDMINVANRLLLPPYKISSPQQIFDTILYEVIQGITKYNASPFVSLHFNKEGILYSVMDQIYQKTLVGHVIGFIDYYMKCFVNGGFFKEEFIYTWYKSQNSNPDYLNASIIPLRKNLKRKYLI
jgi:hypothetical protein